MMTTIETFKLIPIVSMTASFHKRYIIIIFVLASTPMNLNEQSVDVYEGTLSRSHKNMSPRQLHKDILISPFIKCALAISMRLPFQYTLSEGHYYYRVFEMNKSLPSSLCP